MTRGRVKEKTMKKLDRTGRADDMDGVWRSACWRLSVSGRIDAIRSKIDTLSVASGDAKMSTQSRKSSTPGRATPATGAFRRTANGWWVRSTATRIQDCWARRRRPSLRSSRKAFRAAAEAQTRAVQAWEPAGTIKRMGLMSQVPPGSRLGPPGREVWRMRDARPFLLGFFGVFRDLSAGVRRIRAERRA